LNQIPQITMTDGHPIPQIGFGTYRLNDDLAISSVERALEVGYRHFDTAASYHNETEVGATLASSGLPRDELFITSKVWTDGLADPRRALETSLEKLKLDHLDLYLIHWPSVIKHGRAYVDCWDQLQVLRDEGLTTSIGVSNFHDHHLAELRGAVPAINQVEVHPSFTQPELSAQLAARGIPVAAWSPLGRARDLTDQVIQQISVESGRTPGQVVLRWHLAAGRVVIPRSSNPDRIAENFQLLDFRLSTEQCALIDSLNDPVNGRTRGLNPDTADW
jgi:2,5-diketo-D-gluconate reductase A